MIKHFKILFAISFAIIINSCGLLETPTEDKIRYGSLNLLIDFSFPDSQLLDSTDMVISYYDLEGIGPDNNQISLSNITETELNISDLLTGSWSLTVQGKNSNGDIVAKGTDSIEIIEGTENTHTIALVIANEISPLIIKVTIPDDEILNPVLEATLKDMNGTSQSISFTLSEANTYVYTSTSLTGTHYSITIIVKDSNTETATVIEYFTISNGQITEIVIPLTSTDIKTPPVTPSDFTATEGVELIQLSWSDNSMVETGYTIERKEENEESFTVLSDTILAGETVYLDTDVTEGVTYTYRLKARNSFGASDYTDSITGIYSIPSPVSTISGNPSTMNPNPQFSWYDVDSAVRYRYSINENDDSWLETTSTHCTITDISDGEHIAYIQAGDEAGNWSTSTEFHFTVYLTDLDRVNDEILKPSGNYESSYIHNDLLLFFTSVGLKIYDLSTDSSEPQLISTVDIDDVEDIVIDEDLIYVAQFYYGFDIIDISDPYNPIKIEFENDYFTGQANGIDKVDNYILITTVRFGLKIIDVSDIYNPDEISALQLGEVSHDDIDVYGNYAYVAADELGVKVIDITDLNNPVLVNTIPTDHAHDIYIGDNNLLYLADGARESHLDGGLKIIDITDPLNTSESDIIGAYSGSQIWATNVSVHNGYAYLSCTANRSLKIIDVRDPYNPILSTTSDSYIEGATAIYDNKAYIGDGQFGYYILDISSPESPSIIFENINVQPIDIINSGNFTYTACGTKGVYILDTTNSTSPQIIKNIPMVYANSLAIKDGYLFVGNNFLDGLQVVDISEPANATIVAEIDNLNVEHMVIDGSKLYTNWTYTGINIIDISNPSNCDSSSIMVNIPHYLTYDDPVQFQVNGDYIYVASKNSDGLQIYDISDLNNITLLTDFEIDSLKGIALYENYALLSNEDNIIYAVDISYPSNITIQHQWDASSYGKLKIYNSTLTITTPWDFMTEFTLYDVYNPLMPELLGEIDLYGVNSCDINNDGLYLFSSTNGLAIYQ